MPMSGIEVQGADRVKQMLAIIADVETQVHEGIGEHARQDATEIRAKGYPAPPPNSRYIRTFQLKANIRTFSPKRGEWHTDNFTSYAVWVLKELWQVAIHLGRWWTTEDVVNKNIENLGKNMAAALERKLRAL